MKLTIFVGGLSGGGTERVVCNLANYLVSKGHIIEIITMSDDEPSYVLSDQVNRIILLRKQERKNFVVNSFLRFFHLRQYIKHSDTDGYLAMLTVSILLLLGLHHCIKVPILVSERGDPNSNSIIAKYLLKRLAKYGDGFVFQTEDAEKWYNHCIEGKPRRIIFNAINEDALCNGCNPNQREKKIVAVGRLFHAKNFAMLINAFSIVHKKYNDYSLIIYGEGALRLDLENEVRQLFLEDYVFLPGYISNVSDKINNASLFVLSSDCEGIPNALIEAMALGIPCISTDCPVGGPRYLISNGQNGILTPVGDVDSLANAMINLLDNPEYAEQLGQNAMLIRKQLDPIKIYSEWEEFISEILMT